MAEINVERKPSGQFTWLWVALSLVLMVGFFWWLSVKAEPTSGPIVQEETPEEEAEGAAVTPEQLAAGAAAYAGQDVRLRDVTIASRMGAQAFWIQLPNDQPFLVKLDSALVAGGRTVAGGQRVSVAGRLHAMSDSVLDAWQQSGGIADEVERAEAEFAQHFIEARELTAQGAGGPEGRDD